MTKQTTELTKEQEIQRDIPYYQSFERNLIPTLNLKYCTIDGQIKKKQNKSGTWMYSSFEVRQWYQWYERGIKDSLMKKIKLRNINQLVSEGFLKPNVEEPECLEISCDTIEIVYVSEQEVVDSFYLDEDSISFCSLCGIDHINEYDAQLTDKVFAVYQVIRTPL